MNPTDCNSDDKFVSGSDAAALGHCKVHYTVLTLSQIAQLLEQEYSEEEPEVVEQKISIGGSRTKESI